jgi:competence protein ComEA
MTRKLAVTLLALVLCLSLGAGSALAQGKDAAKKASPPAASTKQKSELIDINSASKQELMTLPVIGDAYSNKIIDNRPYRAKNELIQKKLIPQATYDKISGQIIAKQNTTAPAAKKK